MYGFIPHIPEVDVFHLVLRVIAPVHRPSGGAELECIRKPDEIHRRILVLHIEERPDPPLAGVDGECPRKPASGPGHDGGRPALGHLYLRVVLIRDRLTPELEVLGEEVERGPYPDVGLREGREAAEVDESVRRKVVGKQLELLEEGPQEVGNGKAEAPLEMRHEDDMFAGLDLGLDLA